MKPTEEIDLATYRRLSARTRSARASIPRAEATPRDGLTTLLRAGWSTRMPGGLHQLYRDGQETGLHADLSDACKEAKRMMKEGKQ